MSGLLMSHREKISCMWHFQTVVLKTVLLRIVVSIYVMKILAKESNDRRLTFTFLKIHIKYVVFMSVSSRNITILISN